MGEHFTLTRPVEAELAHAARVSTLGELTASIAHEVKQPLAAVSSLAGCLAETEPFGLRRPACASRRKNGDDC